MRKLAGAQIAAAAGVKLCRPSILSFLCGANIDELVVGIYPISTRGRVFRVVNIGACALLFALSLSPDYPIRSFCCPQNLSQHLISALE